MPVFHCSSVYPNIVDEHNRLDDRYYHGMLLFEDILGKDIFDIEGNSLRNVARGFCIQVVCLFYRFFIVNGFGGCEYGDDRDYTLSKNIVALSCKRV